MLLLFCPKNPFCWQLKHNTEIPYREENLRGHHGHMDQRLCMCALELVLGQAGIEGLIQLQKGLSLLWGQRASPISAPLHARGKGRRGR